MNSYSRTFRYAPLARGIGGLLVGLVCAMALFGCSGGKDTTTIIAVPATTGSLNVIVNPAAATVNLTGPGSYSQTFTGNGAFTNLAPGQYTARASSPGFVEAASQIQVFAGQTATIRLVLLETPIISEGPRAVYRDDEGGLIPLDDSNIQSGTFVFYAWLEDEPFGILTAKLTSPDGSDPGKPLTAEQTEFAPSLTQNLAGAYVGFMDAAGVVRPVIGADVRWEIDQQYAARVGSTQFGTSDDNRVALGYGVFDDQADTRTNNGRLAAERFPLIATDYPLFNQTGIGTPFADGFTWVTLFSPDATAAARIVAVATINGEEIGKQILYKNFAPAPKLEITKTVNTELVNLDVSGTVTWTVTVKNTGTGDATNVNLHDILASGNGAGYTLGALPAGCTATADPDIFNCIFTPLAAPGAPAPPQNTQLLGNAWSFAVLANATVTNTSTAANPTVVNGDVGVSAGSAITGFPTGIVLNGTLHNNDAVAVAAQTALTAAYAALGDASSRPCTGPVNQAITGTFTPGVYCYDSSVTTGTSLTLDAQNDPAAEFVFRIDSTLDTPAGFTVTLINGANPCNIYWKVGSAATLGDNNFFVGNILAQQSITVGTGTSISGRALARVGAVSLQTNAINAPLSCVAAPGSTNDLIFTATVNTPGTYCNEVQVTEFTGANGTTTPVDLNDQACFTAVQSNVSIVKDFVADDNTTSLGKAVTVAANIPAKLRVRVINSGTGDATVVNVEDLFTQAMSTGLLANYKLISVAPGTMTDADANGSNDGFTNAIGTLAQGTTATMLFTVSASTDGVYCDTATVTAATGTIGVGSDSACLTVATPNLTITKIDAPDSVNPGANYTSKIDVTNNGNATARNVVIRDLLGNLNINADGSSNANPDVQAIYVSSSLNNLSGTLANRVVTAGTIDIPAGDSVTFTVVSRIPLGAVSGDYCDTATVTSSNTVTRQATDCINVPAFSALQTQLVDLADPVSAGSNVSYFSVLYVESLSNEGVNNSVLTYSFGLDNPVNLGQAGSFQVVSTKVYLDSRPVRDPSTGVVVSDTTNATAVLLTEGADYTLVTTAPGGKQVITMSTGIALQPDTALYVVNDVLVPSTVPANRMYTTSYIWVSNGLVVPSHVYTASSSEPTTVLP